MIRTYTMEVEYQDVLGNTHEHQVHRNISAKEAIEWSEYYNMHYDNVVVSLIEN